MPGIKIALVGCGRISVRHSDLLGGGHITGASLAAVCDIIPERARALGEKWGVPWFESMYDMIESADFDAVSILTESGNHAEHSVIMANAGKHVIVEKPMALTLDDADRMIAACDANGVRLFVIKQNRFNLPVRKLREAVEAGRFGKLILGTVRVRWCRPQSYYDQDSWRGTWKYDGGVLTNQASHHIDLLEWMLGDARSVQAISTTALADIEAEDTAAAIISFRNGAIGIIEATTATRPKDLEGSLSILGEKGSVEIGGFAVNEIKTWNFADYSEADEDVMKNFSVNPPNVYGFGHKEYYEDVVKTLQSGGPQLVDGLEGRRSLELIMAIYEAIETQTSVDLRFNPKLCKLGSMT